MCTRIVMTITTQNDSSHANAEYKVSVKNFLYAQVYDRLFYVLHVYFKHSGYLFGFYVGTHFFAIRRFKLYTD